MATLVDLSDVYRETRQILNDIVGKYDSLHFIGTDEDNDNKPYYLAKDIVEGFYYKEAETGEGNIQETIFFVPENDTIEEAVVKAVIVELVNEDGTFTRCSIDSKTKPKRPSFQWVLVVKPNKQDKRVIA